MGEVESQPDQQRSPEVPVTAHRDPRRDASVAGFVGIAGATGVLGLLNVVAPGAPFPPFQLAQSLVRATPGGVATFFIENLGHLALPLGVIAISGLFLLLGLLLGRLIPLLETKLGWKSIPACFLAMTPAWLLWFAVSPPGLRKAHLGGYLTTLVTGIVASTLLSAFAIRKMREEPAVTGPSDPSRRYFMRAAAAGAGGIVVGAVGLNRIVRPGSDPSAGELVVPTLSPVAPPPSSGTAFEIEGLTPEITPIKDFYTVDEAFVDPSIDTADWKLAISGLVSDPVALSYDRIRSMPAIERFQTLACISNPVGGDLISTTKWTGIPVRHLLEEAGVSGKGVEVVFRAADGFSDSLSLDQAMDESTLLVVGMDGRPLSRSHGYPARLLSVGTYGMKNPKWLTEIEVVDHAYDGFWEQRGWAKVAPVKMQVRIDVPRDARVGVETVVAGLAFAGDRGVSRLELSDDGGETWTDAQLKPPLSDLTWVLWKVPWTPKASGSQELVARATDGRGDVQTSMIADPHPEGASGLESAVVDVSGA